MVARLELSRGGGGSERALVVGIDVVFGAVAGDHLRGVIPPAAVGVAGFGALAEDLGQAPARQRRLWLLLVRLGLVGVERARWLASCEWVRVEPGRSRVERVCVVAREHPGTGCGLQLVLLAADVLLVG